MTMEKQILRGEPLWISGILVLIIATAIQGYVSVRHRYRTYVRENANACILPVDFEQAEVIQETHFIPMVTRDYSLRLVLSRELDVDLFRYWQQHQEYPPDNIRESIDSKEFALSWHVYRNEQSIANGRITPAHINEVVGFGYRRVDRYFDGGSVRLKGKASHRLVVSVNRPYPELNKFRAEIWIRTWPGTGKGEWLAGWRIRDTVLMALLGAGLVCSGAVIHHHQHKV
jgi:hypothetical protein